MTATECAPGQHRMVAGTCQRCGAGVTAGPASLAIDAGRFGWILVSRDGAFLGRGNRLASAKAAHDAADAAFKATGRKLGTIRITRDGHVTNETKARS